MNVNTYRKQPIEIKAIQFDGTNEVDIELFMKESNEQTGNLIGSTSGEDDDLYIETIEGVLHISQDDFVIRGIKGEFYPCRPDIFYETYELVE
jgi:hypothetical protein